MKKKYYYDCLIKALYMNKEFGVDFFIKDDDGDDYNFTEWYLNSQNVLELFTELEAFPCRIYVKSESEHIFELKEYDSGIYNNELWTFIAGQWVLSSDYERRTEDYDFITNTVERDDKHFFTPIKEEN